MRGARKGKPGVLRKLLKRAKLMTHHSHVCNGGQVRRLEVSTTLLKIEL